MHGVNGVGRSRQACTVVTAEESAYFDEFSSVVPGDVIRLQGSIILDLQCIECWA